MSNDKRPFNPTGPTIKVAADTTAPTGLQALSIGGKPAENFRIHNAGTETIYVAFGIDAATAQSNAVIPTGGGASAKRSIPLPPGAIEVLSASIDAYWSGITAVAPAALYVTPGLGY